MKSYSLRFRLIAAWAVFISVALVTAGVGLHVLFERSIIRRSQAELEADLRQLQRGMEVRPSGEVLIAREPTDPQFDIYFGGRYWQIEEQGEVIVRSRSLENARLNVPKDPKYLTSGQTAKFLGPEEQHLIAVIRLHKIADAAENNGSERTLQITTAVDAAEIEDDTQKFASELFASLSLLAILLLAGAWIHVSFVVRPLEEVRSKVARVRSGKSNTLDGNFPDELMPLVAETNELLRAQASALRLARERAADLAHGLNTPLAIMAVSSRTLEKVGMSDIAADIDRQIEIMRRHVERELARTRARGRYRADDAGTDVANLARNIIQAVSVLPSENSIEWLEHIPPQLIQMVDADDFNNILGNLVENAQKWARKVIHVGIDAQEGVLTIVVEDDGPGIPEQDLKRVLKRGERADTSVGGTGLGLAIVHDLVELYRGNLILGKSSRGGASVTVVLRPEPPLV